MSYEVKHRGKIKENMHMSSESGIPFGVHRKAPGVTLPSDHLSEDELAAMSSKCVTVIPAKVKEES